MQTVPLLEEFKTAPAVFAVGNEYQIMVPVKSELLFWVSVGDQTFYDHINGIMRSKVPVHSVHVPMALLDRVGTYTVHYRKIIDRKAYFSESEDEVSATYPFYPIPTDRPVQIYHLSDTHGEFSLPVAAASYLSDGLDLLILNGDIQEDSSDAANFDLIYRICEAITGGSRPIIFSRGNHDMRGCYAEDHTIYTPTDRGNSYFTFRIGNVWGIVLDAGEDKPDDHEAYGHTNACHGFRLAQTEFIKKAIENAANEYEAQGITHRLVIAHHPFSRWMHAPFDNEYDIYTEWIKLLGTHVKPHLLISGHLHENLVNLEGGQLDELHAVPFVVGSSGPRRNEERVRVRYVGAAITLLADRIKVEFTNQAREVEETHEILM